MKLFILLVCMTAILARKSTVQTALSASLNQGPTGENLCECDDGTLTCACVDTTAAEGENTTGGAGQLPPPPPPQGQEGENVCDCGDGTFTCACVDTAATRLVKEEEGEDTVAEGYDTVAEGYGQGPPPQGQEGENDGQLPPPPPPQGQEGENVCECDDGTFTCACVDTAASRLVKEEEGEDTAAEGDGQLPPPPQGQEGENTCECDDGTFTCACVDTTAAEGDDTTGGDGQGPPPANPTELVKDDDNCWVASNCDEDDGTNCDDGAIQVYCDSCSMADFGTDWYTYNCNESGNDCDQGEMPVDLVSCSLHD